MSDGDNLRRGFLKVLLSTFSSSVLLKKPDFRENRPILKTGKDLAEAGKITFPDLVSLKAADPGKLSYILVSGTRPDGIFAYESANAPYVADDIDVIKLDSVPLAVGALVRQKADSVSYQYPSDDGVRRPLNKVLMERVNFFDFIPDQIVSDIKTHLNQVDLRPYFEKANAQAPLGCDWHWSPGDYRMLTTPTMKRQMNIIAPGARLQGLFGTDHSKNLLDIRLEEAGNDNGDARRMRISGLTAYIASGGNHCLDIANRKPLRANHLMLIENSSFGVSPTSRGVAVHYHGGASTQMHTMRHCEVNGGVWFDDCADDCHLDDMLFYGEKLACLIDVTKGAFKTRITNFVVRTRDGGFKVVRGSYFVFDDGTMEQQGDNKTENSAHIAIIPKDKDYPSNGGLIRGVTFGGGVGPAPASRISHAIYADGTTAGVEDMMIDGCTFGRTASVTKGLPAVDIYLGRQVRGTVIAPNQRVRGNRAGVLVDRFGRAASNSKNPADLLVVQDDGSETYGVWKSGSELSLGRDVVASPGFRVRKNMNDTIQFEGKVTVKKTCLGSILFNLPSGMRPPEETRWILPSVAADASAESGTAVLQVNSDGNVLLVSITAAGDIYFASASGMGVRGRVTYQPGV